MIPAAAMPPMPMCLTYVRKTASAVIRPMSVPGAAGGTLDGSCAPKCATSGTRRNQETNDPAQMMAE